MLWQEWACNGCGLTNADREGVEEQYSLGLYAGRYHDDCWERSGYRKDGSAGFDPDDAGEQYEAE